MKRSLFYIFIALISFGCENEVKHREGITLQRNNMLVLASLMNDFQKNEKRLPETINELEIRYSEPNPDTRSPFVFYVNGSPKEWLFSDDDRTFSDTVLESPETFESGGEVYRFYLDQKLDLKYRKIK